MKKLNFFLVIVVLILNFPSLLAQTNVQFDSPTTIDLGEINFGKEIERLVKFKNVGDKPISIFRLTFDGGVYAWCSHDPILPGQEDKIRITYDTHRLGAFQKYIGVNFIDTCYLFSIKGEVIVPKTTAIANTYEFDLGELQFGETDSIQIEFTNTGNELLHINNCGSDCPLIELAYVQWDYDSSQYISRFDFFGVPKSGKKMVKLFFKNYYGKVGKFEKQLKFKYNSPDSIMITIRGEFVGKPQHDTILESNWALIYNNNKLLKRIVYSTMGTIQEVDIFEGFNCIKSNEYYYYKSKPYKEDFFENGKLIQRIIN